MKFDTKLYFSGSMQHLSVVKKLMDLKSPRLLTFATWKEVPRYLGQCDEAGYSCDMVIDSGAFSSWNIGKPVELKDLLLFDKWLIRTYPQHNFTFIALDVIPGSRSRMPDQDEINKAVEQSYQNFLVMQQELAGYTVLPVYHSGEDRFVRDRYLEHTNHMCLAMNQNLSEKSA